MRDICGIWREGTGKICKIEGVQSCCDYSFASRVSMYEDEVDDDGDSDTTTNF